MPASTIDLFGNLRIGGIIDLVYKDIFLYILVDRTRGQHTSTQGSAEAKLPIVLRGASLARGASYEISGQGRSRFPLE